MATYIELSELLESSTFRRRVRFAMMVSAADTLTNSGASAALKDYARKVLFADVPDNDLRRVTLRCTLSSAGQANGENMTDAQIQTVVDNVFPGLV